MSNKYSINDTAFIIVSNRVIREIKVLNYSGGFYTIKFVNGNGGLRLRENRLFVQKKKPKSRFPKQGQHHQRPQLQNAIPHHGIKEIKHIVLHLPFRCV